MISYLYQNDDQNRIYKSNNNSENLNCGKNSNFLNFCWMIRMQPISLPKLFLLYCKNGIKYSLFVFLSTSFYTLVMFATSNLFDQHVLAKMALNIHKPNLQTLRIITKRPL